MHLGWQKITPFVDGNKRIAFMTDDELPAQERRCISALTRHNATAMILSLAAGEVSEQSLTRWIRDNWPLGAPK